MLRATRLVLFCALAATQIPAQPPTQQPPFQPRRFSVEDPAFASVPFHEWFTPQGQARIRWSAQISKVQLSVHQRLISRVEFSIDGAEIGKRRGQGRLVMMIEFKDSAGGLWQDHDSIDLEKTDAAISANNVLFNQTFFALPGDYQASFALYDTATGEHATIRRSFSVAAPHNDPLPGAWRDLPAIEFIGSATPPDSWYLPAIAGRLHIEGTARHPLKLDIVLNLTPSARLEGSTRVQSRNLASLIPALKVLTSVTWKNVSVNVSLLDLTRRRAAFEQTSVQRFSWRRARMSLGETNPGIIDVKSLGDHKYEAQFFLDEIAKRLDRAKSTAGEPEQVVIVLSSPVEFDQDQDLTPIARGENPGARVYYIRYQPLSPYTIEDLRRQDARKRLTPQGYLASFDQLEPLLKPIGPRLFDVSNPEQFRKALATILSEIGKI